MTVKPRFLTRLYNVIFYGVASLVVIAAVSLSLVRGLLANVESYRTDIEQLASASLGQAITVKIDSLDAGFSGFTPTLIARGVRFLGASGQVEVVDFDKAEIGVSLYESLRNNKLIPSKVVVSGIELVVTRRKDKSIRVLGVDIMQMEGVNSDELQDSDLTEWLFRHTNLALQDSVIIWKDLNKDDHGLRFENVNMVLQNTGEQHYLKGYIKLPKKIGARLDVALSIKGKMHLPDTWQGGMYLNARQINLDQWQEYQYLTGNDVTFHKGKADTTLWASVENGRLKNLSGDVMLNNVSVSSKKLTGRLKLDFIGGLFEFEKSLNGWDLVIDRFKASSGSRLWPVSRFNVSRTWSETDKSSEIEVKADYFRLEDLFFLSRKLKLENAKWYKTYTQAKPSGDVVQLHLAISEKENKIKNYHLRSRFKQLSMSPIAGMPGFNGINGTIWLDEKQGEINLSSDFASVKIQKLLTSPITLNELEGRFNWRKSAHTWQVWSNDVSIRNNDITTLSQFQVDIPFKGKSPFIDLQVSFLNGNASQAKKYFPYAIMPDGLVNWLKGTSMSGKVVDGGAVFRGRLADFPYIHPVGQFKAVFNGRNMGLDYLPGWPKISQADFFAHFDSRGLAFNVKKLKILNTKSKSGKVSIGDYKHARLVIDGDLSGPVKDIFTFAVESPIQPQARTLVDNAVISGQADTRLHVDIPLSTKESADAALNYQGEIQINNGALALWDKKVEVSGISGNILFSDKEYKARNMQGLLYGRKAEFDIFTRKESDAKVLSIISRSSLDIADGFKRLGYLPGNKVSGASEWQLALNFRGKKGTGVSLDSLSMRSDLVGVTSNLPLPLNKEMSQARELSLQVKFNDNDNYKLNANYDNQVTFASKQHQARPEKIAVHFGPEAAELSDKPVLRLSGVAKNISLKAWMKTLQELRPTTGKVQDILPIEFAMEELIIDKDEQTTLVTPKFLIRPADIPLISGYANNFNYHGVALGKMTLTTSRIRKGIRFEHIEFDAPPHRFIATGEWRQGLLGDTSQFDVKLTSDNVEQLLAAFGYSAVITGGVLELNGSFAWPDRPEQFSLKSAMGKMHVNIQDGRIVEVDAGAGRLLGLFSVAALPRRLALDFKDAFQSGFSFDDMVGDIEIKDGSAYSDEVKIKSPVATIEVNGRTDYLKQTFDQHVVVTPKVGNTLPLAGGLIFGLEIGAAIALIDTIMGKTFDKASKREYHITGNWEKPLITEIKKETPVQQSDEDSFSDDDI